MNKYIFRCTRTSLIDYYRNPEKTPHEEAYWDEDEQKWYISFENMDDFFDFIRNRLGKNKDGDEVFSFVIHNDPFDYPELEIYDDWRE